MAHSLFRRHFNKYLKILLYQHLEFSNNRYQNSSVINEISYLMIFNFYQILQKTKSETRYSCGVNTFHLLLSIILHLCLSILFYFFLNCPNSRRLLFSQTPGICLHMHHRDFTQVSTSLELTNLEPKLLSQKVSKSDRPFPSLVPDRVTEIKVH